MAASGKLISLSIPHTAGIVRISCRTSAWRLRFVAPAHRTICYVLIQFPYGCQVTGVQKVEAFGIALNICGGGPILLVQHFKQVGIPLSHFPVLTAAGHWQMMDALLARDCDMHHIEQGCAPCGSGER